MTTERNLNFFLAGFAISAETKFNLLIFNENKELLVAEWVQESAEGCSQVPSGYEKQRPRPKPGSLSLRI
ncbi:hypothetical protein [Stenotrophomonas sp.]|uniref:hypothetical protein n=1 Tax=Stenotrophomonas sp. TaxID=69392 RepID=UPI0028A85D01|nr:hypothetical protein [Stenotrophomonas sp.]